MARMNLRFFFMMSMMLLLTGCSNPKIIDKIQIFQTIGYDMQHDKIKGTLIYPTFAEKGKTQLNILETESDSYDDILPRLDTKSTFPIEVGQLRMVLFGKAFAKHGIDAVVHNLTRDPDIGSRMHLGVAENRADSIMLASKNIKMPFHLSNKINHNIKLGNLPKMNLHVFLENYYGEGRDPYLPYFIKELGEVKIDGLALFRKGTYVHHIDIRQSFLLKILVDGIKNGRYKIDIKENDKKGFILLENLNAKTSISIQQIEPIPNISIGIKMKLQIKDAPPWMDLTDNNTILTLEKMLDKHFTQEVQKLISLFQKHRVDPIGLGDMVRAKTKNWNYKQFREIYPQVKTNVSTQFDIIQSGVWD